MPAWSTSRMDAQPAPASRRPMAVTLATTVSISLQAGEDLMAGQVRANDCRSKLSYRCSVGLRPYEAPHVMALLAKQADDAAAQLACTTNNKDHFLALHETAQFSPLSTRNDDPRIESSWRSALGQTGDMTEYTTTQIKV